MHLEQSLPYPSLPILPAYANAKDLRLVFAEPARQNSNYCECVLYEVAKSYVRPNDLSPSTVQFAYLVFRQILVHTTGLPLALWPMSRRKCMFEPANSARGAMFFNSPHGVLPLPSIHQHVGKLPKI